MADWIGTSEGNSEENLAAAGATGSNAASAMMFEKKRLRVMRSSGQWMIKSSH
jgi:hypothetical protein